MTTLAGSPTDVTAWWWQALTSPLSLLTLGMLAASGVGLLGLIVILHRAGQGRPLTSGRVGLLGHQAGTATIEFAFVLPFLLFFALLLVQTMYLAVGNIYVHYAAFAATRSAITVIPADASLDEPANVLRYPDSRKHSDIRTAAVFALLPVSGRLAEDAAPADSRANDIALALADHFGEQIPAWVQNLTPAAYRYADANTQTSLLRIVREDPESLRFNRIDPDTADVVVFGPHEPVSVRVRHRFSLSIPIASAVYAGYDDGDYQHTPATGTGLFRWMQAQYTLTNEGAPRELPPRPTRWDPQTQSWVDLPRLETRPYRE